MKTLLIVSAIAIGGPGMASVSWMTVMATSNPSVPSTK
jgi:hypothetical protein